MKRLLGAASLSFLLYHCAWAQVIEVESNGLKYQALTKSGITVMFAHLQTTLHEYSIIQVTVSNGSPAPYIIRPEDFTFIRSDGSEVRAVPAHTVIEMLTKKANGGDMAKLVTAYEASILGNPSVKSIHGYEERRQAAIASTGSKTRAAAVASALAMVMSRMLPGNTIDGAVFFPSAGKPLGSGRMVVRTNTDTWEFNPE